MTIASAFNDIAVAQGGTAAKSGDITAAIDALNDALAGSDQPQAKTIEQAVRLLGEHIGGGGSSTVRIWFVNTEDPTDTFDSLTVKDGDGSAIVTKIAEYSAQGRTLNLKCADVQVGTPVVLNMVPSELSVSWDYNYDPTIESLQSGAYFIAPASETLAMFEA